MAGQGELWGVVVEQSLVDGVVPAPFEVLAALPLGGWRLLLVGLEETSLADGVARLRAAMIPAAQECWYAHLFDEGRLVVVFADAVFDVTTDALTWEPVIMHGLARGVPLEQLDFDPCTQADARARFGLAAV
ncbi:hypothetical protein [Cellulomonas soli]